MQKPTSSGHAPVNGLNMYYEIYGEGGMPMILIHGGGSTIESSFSNLIPWLVGHSKIVAVELQAHGRTSDRDAPESFEQDADDVAGLLSHLGIGKADFLGFSNGGTTCLQIAIRHPQIIHKLVIISSNYQREGMLPGMLEGMRHATLHDMPVQLREAYLEVAPDKNQLQVMFEKDRDRMIYFTDIPDEALRSIKAPSLLMVADRDVMTVAHVLKMSQLIPDARLAVLPGTHGSFIGEICSADKGSGLPEMTAVLVKEFLGK